MAGVPPLIVMLASAPLVVFAILTFDSLVLIERDRYRASWEADGRPATFYRKRRTFELTARGELARNRCSFAWLFRTPRWMEDDLECARLVGRLRVLVAVWTLGAVPLFLITAVLSSSPP